MREKEGEREKKHVNVSDFSTYTNQRNYNISKEFFFFFTILCRKLHNPCIIYFRKLRTIAIIIHTRDIIFIIYYARLRKLDDEIICPAERGA